MRDSSHRRLDRVGPTDGSPEDSQARRPTGLRRAARFRPYRRYALTRAGCEWIWTDTAPGKLARPRVGQVLEYLRAGDELAVTMLPRMARSVRHLPEIAVLLAERGVDLGVLKQGSDATTPAGRFLFHVIGQWTRCWPTS